MKGDAALFALSGLLLLLNQRTMGATLMIIAVTFILATKDNPFLTTGSRASSPTADYNQRVIDFFKHLSLIGVALLVIDNGGKETVEVREEKVKEE